MSYIEHRSLPESGTFTGMQEALCPCCGEAMRPRSSEMQKEDFVFECRNCSLAYVTREPVCASGPRQAAH